ncbi:Relaxin insulin-like peptide receptor [Chamberlinius hualienensis]
MPDMPATDWCVDLDRSSNIVIGVFAIVGNTPVIYLNLKSRCQIKNKAQRVFITNLAVADLLMGLYQVSIGLTDVIYSGQYYRHANAWLTSWICTAFGLLATLSSQVSVFTLLSMTIERKGILIGTFKSQKPMGEKSLAICVTAIWLLSAILALTPIFIWRHYYGISGTCFPLHIHDPFADGYQYSTFIFLGINLICVLIMIKEYIAIFQGIKKMQNMTPAKTQLKKPGIRIFAMVFTDCLCWIPVFIIKAVAMANIHISDQLNAVVVVIFLPINSALNPLVYTFTGPTMLTKCQLVFDRIKMSVSSSVSKRTFRGVLRRSSANEVKNEVHLLCMSRGNRNSQEEETQETII